MTIQPVSGLPSIRRRSSADHDLSRLYVDVLTARAAHRLTRSTTHPDETVRRNADRLTASLGAYVSALEEYGLPVPAAIRDEFRLRRGLS